MLHNSEHTQSDGMSTKRDSTNWTQSQVVDCVHCGKKIQKNNLKRHLLKQHPKQYKASLGRERQKREGNQSKLLDAFQRSTPTSVKQASPFETPSSLPQSKETFTCDAPSPSGVKGTSQLSPQLYPSLLQSSILRSVVSQTVKELVLPKLDVLLDNTAPDDLANRIVKKLAKLKSAKEKEPVGTTNVPSLRGKTVQQLAKEADFSLLTDSISCNKCDRACTIAPPGIAKTIDKRSGIVRTDQGFKGLKQFPQSFRRVPRKP